MPRGNGRVRVAISDYASSMRGASRPRNEGVVLGGNLAVDLHGGVQRPRQWRVLDHRHAVLPGGLPDPRPPEGAFPSCLPPAIASRYASLHDGHAPAVTT